MKVIENNITIQSNIKRVIDTIKQTNNTNKINLQYPTPFIKEKLYLEYNNNARSTRKTENKAGRKKAFRCNAAHNWWQPRLP